MEARIERVRVDAPARYRPEVEEAARLSRKRGFRAEIDEYNGDTRLTVSGVSPLGNNEYLDFVTEMFVPVFSLDVHVSGDPLRDTLELERAFDERGLDAEFWAA